MNDSCSPRKLEAGLAAAYSKSSVLKTSTMKSEPGLSTVITSADGVGSPSAAATALAASSGVSGSGSAAAADADAADSAETGTAGDRTSDAAPAAAPATAPFRKPRRLTRFFALAIRPLLMRHVL